ncbi:MAG: hypothetical protein A3F13_00855 [Gammaproteobacteria bacterium RIFCSPHIGHO2_12_FULL_40_19]|nr:MAG: hypothetical protein A3F13_00855 [Gammaproteobacteria bacterium RIFCSPHIGHO2_12_FULL_40_19]HLB42232.1 integrase core domain-containing protein [Gammaproteobacteria bacterium]
MMQLAGRLLYYSNRSASISLAIYDDRFEIWNNGTLPDKITLEEQFWRSFKREEFYLNEYQSVSELRKAIGAYIEFYNQQRWHQSLDYKTPAQVYFSGNINQ